MPLYNPPSSAASAAVLINKYGADPTGATFSDAAMTAALATGLVVGALPGTYKFQTAISLTTTTGGINTGQAVGAVIFNWTGSGPFITSHDPLFNISDTNPLLSVLGPVLGFTVDGTSAAAGASAIKIGDQNNPNVFIGARNFTGAGSIGFLLSNSVGWTNEGTIGGLVENCTNLIQFDNSGGGASYGNVNFNFTVKQLANQNVIVAQNSCQMVGGSFLLGGESIAGTTNTGTVLKVGADATAAGFRNMAPFSVGVECAAGAGTVGPVSIALGSAAFLMQNEGLLFFRSQGGNYQASTGLATYRFSHVGWVESATVGDYLANPAVNGIALVVAGGILETLGGTSGGGTGQSAYGATGSILQTTLVSGANSFTFSGLVAGRAQRWIMEFTQPASGGAGTLTLTGGKTTTGSGVITLSATNGVTDAVMAWTPDGVNVRATVLGLNLH